MKKYSSYLIPALVVLVILSFMFRWYRGRVRDQQLSEFGEGVKIENLTEAEMDDVLKGVGDYQTVELQKSETVDSQAEAGQDEMDQLGAVANGMIRYQMEDGKVKFSVISTLPELTSGRYQAWLRTLDDSTLQRVFALEMNKGGYVGSAAVSADLLPFEVIVSKEMTDDSQLEEIIMRGIITAPAAEEMAQ